MTTLDTLRQLQADATPGPWEVEPWPDGAPDADVVAPHRDSAGNRKGFTYIAEGLTPANARVAAAAPTHLADLITALEREAKVRDLHQRIPVYEGCFREDCPDATEDEHLLLDNGGWVHTNELIGHSCSHCYELSDDDWPDYPCPTIRILDGNE